MIPVNTMYEWLHSGVGQRRLPGILALVLIAAGLLAAVPTTAPFDGLAMEDITAVEYWGQGDVYYPLEGEDARRVTELSAALRLHLPRTNRWQEYTGGNTRYRLVMADGSSQEIRIVSPYVVLLKQGTKGQRAADSSVLYELEQFFSRQANHMPCG